MRSFNAESQQSRTSCRFNVKKGFLSLFIKHMTPVSLSLCRTENSTFSRRIIGLCASSVTVKVGNKCGGGGVGVEVGGVLCVCVVSYEYDASYE